MRLLYRVATVALLLTVSACAAGTDASQDAAQNGDLSQLLLGFWHGVIAPVTLIGEIINTFAPGTLPWTFDFYEARGTTVLYDAAFFIGIFVGPSGILTAFTRRRGVKRHSKL